MMAFAVESYVDTRVLLNDPRYIRFYAQVMRSNAETGRDYSVHHMLHPCSSEEFHRFHPPINQATGDKMQRLQQNGQIFCLDWKALDYNLYGAWLENGDYQAVNVRLVPCAT